MALRNTRLLVGPLKNLNILCRTVSPSSNIVSRQLSSLLYTGATYRNNIDTHQRLTGLQGNDDKILVNAQGCIQIRHYSKKGKSKPKSSKHEHGVELDESITSQIIDINTYEEQLNKILENLKHEYVHKLSLRTSIGNFNSIEVKADKETIPLNHIASIVQKNPSLIILNLSQNVKYVPAVMSALQSSGMSLNPKQEGPSTIYINIPKVSRERREELAKSAKILFNHCKEKLDKHFADTMKKVKKSSSTDVVKTIESKLLQDKKKMQTEAELLMKAKQKELLES